VVTNPRRAARSTVDSSWLRFFRCTEDKKIMNTSKNLLPPLDIGSHSNASAHLLPEAGARNERTLEAVRCSAWFGSVAETRFRGLYGTVKFRG
jgi:hypothetical protein